MKLIFISGPSGSGKTTLSNQIIKKNIKESCNREEKQEEDSLLQLINFLNMR